MKWLVGLLALACAAQRYDTKPVGLCSTSCGLQAEGGRCVALQAAVNETMKAFAANVSDHWTEAKMCSALKGWRIQLHKRVPTDDKCILQPGTSWMKSGSCIVGYTEDTTEVIELPDNQWEDNAMAHELVHVFDWTFSGHMGHCQWKERGVKRSLAQLTGEEDTTTDECALVPPASP